MKQRDVTNQLEGFVVRGGHLSEGVTFMLRPRRSQPNESHEKQMQEEPRTGGFQAKVPPNSEALDYMASLQAQLGPGDTAVSPQFSSLLVYQTPTPPNIH